MSSSGQQQHVPVFTWITVENSTSAGGAFTTTPRVVLQVDVQLVQNFIAHVGARRWALLWALALHSEHSPEHGGRRVVVATLADLGAWAGGGDSGWSEGAIRPAISALEQGGYLERAGRRRRGYQRGSDPTTWVLADGLFAVPKHHPAADLRQVAGTAARLSTESPMGTPPLVAVPAPAGVPAKRTTTPTTRRGKLSAVPDPDTTTTPYTGDSGPVHGLARLGDTLRVSPLNVWVETSLHTLGWTSPPVSDALAEYGTDRMVAWLVYALPRGLKGGWVRNQLKKGPGHWPDGVDSSSTYEMGPAGPHLCGAPGAVGATQLQHVTQLGDGAAAPAVKVITIRELDALFEELPSQLSTEIRDAALAASQRTHPSGLERSFDVKAYRLAVTKELGVRNLWPPVNTTV